MSFSCSTRATAWSSALCGMPPSLTAFSIVLWACSASSGSLITTISAPAAIAWGAASGAPWAAPIARFFTYVIPVMLIVGVPAEVMVRALEPLHVLYALAATLVMMYLARKFFRYSLQKYRSASS